MIYHHEYNYPLERVGFAEGKGGVCNPPERVWL